MQWIDDDFWSLEECTCVNGQVGRAGKYVLICEMCTGQGVVLRRRALLITKEDNDAE